MNTSKNNKKKDIFTSESNCSIKFLCQSQHEVYLTIYQPHGNISLRIPYSQYLAVTQKLISEHRDIPEDANNIMKEMFVQKCKQKSGRLSLFLSFQCLNTF